MKRLLLVAAIFLILNIPRSISARFLDVWPYEKLFAKSDFVVIAKPLTVTHDTKERSVLPKIMPDVAVIGVVTEFHTLLVLKGSKRDRFTLHHYRLSDPDAPIVNGPTLVSFDPNREHMPYLLFLVREADGRYAPVAGQIDPENVSVQKLSGYPE